MNKLISCIFQELELDNREVKAGWYAADKTGQICSGRFSDQDACEAHITQERAHIDAYHQGAVHKHRIDAEAQCARELRFCASGNPVVLIIRNFVRALVVLPDGRLAGGDDDGNIRLWSRDGAGKPSVLTQAARSGPVAGRPAGQRRFGRQLQALAQRRRGRTAVLTHGGHRQFVSAMRQILILGWLGHRSITSTAVYTALAPNRLKDFWRN
jgi:hypothetical protein